MKRPVHVDQFERYRSAVEKFVVTNGGKVLQPTNQYEVLRVCGEKGNSTMVLYQKKTGMLSWTPPLEKMWKAMKSKQPYGGFVETTQRSSLGKTKKQIIIDRDGSGCFYCGAEGVGLTQEHVLSKTHGGSNHVANIVLACAPCNEEAGHMSVAEKFRFAFEKRS